MKIMLGMLISMLNYFKQVAQDSFNPVIGGDVRDFQKIGVLRDLFEKLNSKDEESWFKELKKFLRKEACWVPVEQYWLSVWQKLYKDVFDLEVDLSTVKIPKKPEYPCRLIIVVRGVDLNQIYNACAKYFSMCELPGRYTSGLVQSITKNDRDAERGTYAVWIRDVVQDTTAPIDKDLENLSANDLEAQGVQGITLGERMLHELQYFLETEDHELFNWTLCSGSRDLNGYVPTVRWLGHKDEGLFLFYADINDKKRYLCPRRVVFLDA